jgi:hypothetical protein
VRLTNECARCEDAEFLLVTCDEHPEAVAQRLGMRQVETLRQHLRRDGRRDLLTVINGWTPVNEGWTSRGVLGERTLHRVLDELVMRSRGGERMIRR